MDWQTPPSDRMTEAPFLHSSEREPAPEPAGGPVGATRRTVMAALAVRPSERAALGLTAVQATASPERNNAAQAPRSRTASG